VCWSTVRRWVRQFKGRELGQADLSDSRRSGRPASDQLHQDRVEELIRGNGRIKQKKIAVALGISKGRVGHWCSWIPKSLCHVGTVQQEVQFNAWTFQCCRIHRIAQI